LKAILLLCAALIVLGAVLIFGLRLAKATRLWPAGLLIVTAPLEVYRSSSGAGANVSLFRLALAVALVALGVDLVRRRKTLKGGLTLPFVIYGVLVAWQLVSLVFITPNQSLAYRFLGQYAGGLVAAFVIARYVERRDVRVLIGLCGCAAVLPLLAAVFRVFSVRNGGSGDLPGLSELPLNPVIEAARQSGSFLLDGTQRLNATFSDPNVFGFYIATVLLVLTGMVCAIVLLEKPIRWKAAASYGLLLFCAAVALIGTYSRSAWLLVAVGLIVFAVILGPAFWTRRRAMAAGAAALVVLGIAAPFILSRVSSSEAGNAISTHVHEHTMSIALKLVGRHPLIGVGLGDYGHYAGEPPLVSSAHSTFLTVAAELGIPGVALLVAAIAATAIAAVRSAAREQWATRAQIAGFAAAYVALAIANIFYEAWMDDFQWVLFGMLLALTTQRSLLHLPPRLRKRAARESYGEYGETHQTEVLL
jgi:hypothetical protein